jgi:hypothetical protein
MFISCYGLQRCTASNVGKKAARIAVATSGAIRYDMHDHAQDKETNYHAGAAHAWLCADVQLDVT